MDSHGDTDTLRHLARRDAEEIERRSKEALRLHAALPVAVRLLVERFGVKRVILFGSLARGDLSGDLDVDLAVEGLPPARHWEATSEVAALVATDVDLVPLEEASPSLAEQIRREGRVLHG